MSDQNDYQPADNQNSLLRKILGRLKQLVSGGGSTVTLTASDIEIGAVELKNGTTDDRAEVLNSVPAGTEFGLAVRVVGGAALVGGRLDTNVGAWLGSTAPTVGQKTAADSIPVVLASDQSNVATTNASLGGVLDANNSTTATLLGGFTFTGAFTDVLTFAEIQVHIFSTASSAVDGISIQFSEDGVNARAPHITYSLTGSIARSFTIKPKARYWRIVYTNGAAPNSPFSIQSILRPAASGFVAVPSSTPPNGHEMAIVTRNVPFGTQQVAGAVTTSATSTQDSGNSTSTLLGIAGNFTGTGFAMDGFASWSVNVFADQASAVNGLKVQWSDDNVNWDFTDQATFVASVGNMVTFGRKARFVRLNFTNGGVGQGTFRVVAFGHPIFTRQTRKFIQAALTDADTGQVVIAALQGHTTAGGGSWVDVKVNPSGAMAVDATNAGVFAVQDSEKVVDNNPFTDGTTKVQPSGYIFDETAGTALTENDAAAARIDSKRAQVMVIEDATTRGQRLAVSSAGVASVALKPQTSGGFTTFHLVSGASTNATNIKASAGQLFGWYIYNSNAAARKVAFHNTAGSPTAGASIFFSLMIPPGSGANVFNETGIAFSTGIAITTVTGLADADSAAVAANDLIINLWYS